MDLRVFGTVPASGGSNESLSLSTGNGKVDSLALHVRHSDVIELSIPLRIGSLRELESAIVEKRHAAVIRIDANRSILIVSRLDDTMVLVVVCPAHDVFELERGIYLTQKGQRRLVAALVRARCAFDPALLAEAIG